ncbi:type II secretion system F family protein [Quadrisphaera oryzae]|uniref:type II secretion system F family protein n=1 Tax=Quadrisphaera TaxID=317661 RepID=UPI0016495132|nr:type II secretion system F family protein [Quadrisphaera sp. RL12-1S]MBC3760487.1 type II secretion system F family protein [Quadrisphaera sp. RL12-1S]
MSGGGALEPAALLAALLAGAGAWLLLRGPALPAGRGLAQRREGAGRGPGGPRRRGHRVRRLLPGGPGEEPPEVRVARAASEVAALLRAGAVPAAAWAPQRLQPQGPQGPHGLHGLRGGRGPGAGAGGAPDGVAVALDAAARASAAGEDPAEALRRHPAGGGRACAALGSLSLAWRTSEVTGAPAAAVLDGLASALRDEAAATDSRDAALAGPRATARLLLALPPLGLAASTALGADPVAVLVGTAAGRWSAALGAAFALAGWLWTAALVRAAVRAR